MAQPPAINRRRRRSQIVYHPDLVRASNTEIQAHLVTTLEYGSKVAGLQILPSSWVPPYAALPAWLFDEWLAEKKDWHKNAKRMGADAARAFALVSDRGCHRVIVRSSAVGEGLDDRGRYLSVTLGKNATAEQFFNAVEEIYRQFDNHAKHVAIGICVQRFLVGAMSGHVSNEVHLSPTRNQWKFGIEHPTYVADRGINSKFASTVGEAAPLRIQGQKGLPLALRQICNWVNLRVDSRSHMEWVVAGGHLWIVQLDQESPTSSGLNPHEMPNVRAGNEEIHALDYQPCFSQYRVQMDSPWRKLRNVRDFWVDAEPPKHRLYFATGKDIAAALTQREGPVKLANEIDLLTAGRAVLRTDCNDPSITAFNLPRTHTVDGQRGVAWLAATIGQMTARGAQTENFAFILHRYIPARAAAWSYYSPGEDIVRVDCLWGLPDGLQFLSHDSFELDARTGAEIAAEVRFKRDILQEQDDGDWLYVRVARQFGRDRVLSRDALQTIALKTVQVARHLGERAQIMWFCDLPSELGLGDHLPWYRSKDYLAHVRVERPAIPARRVSTLQDLAKVDSAAGPFIIQVQPEVELVRDDERFLDRVVAVAKRHNAPIELAGSILGHAYYKLRDAGVLVIVPQPKYQRVRGRKTHRKLVRDAIPTNIAARGERVAFGRLHANEAITALIGKLFEEGLELNAAGDHNARLEELADVLEVVRGLASISKISWKRLIAAANEKRASRGGFARQTVLLETGKPKHENEMQTLMGGDGNDAAVSLRDIGVVSVGHRTASIPFTRLLAKAGLQFEMQVENRTVAFHLEMAGSELRLEIDPIDQMQEPRVEQGSLFDSFDTAPKAGTK